MHYLTEKDIIILNIYVINKYSPKEQIGVKEATALNMLVNARTHGSSMYLVKNNTPQLN